MKTRILILMLACWLSGLANADDASELACQRCYRYCSGVSTTDACNDKCYTNVCEPMWFDVFDERNHF